MGLGDRLEKIIATSIIRRQVLIEKAPFLIEILDTPISRSWWYGIYAGRNLYVRNASFEDVYAFLPELIYEVRNIGAKDFYVIMDMEENVYMGDLGVVLKSDCKIVPAC
jgi:hypothetical protein